MSPSIKEYPKQIPGLYSFLRFRKMEAVYAIRCLKIIRGYLRPPYSKPVKERLPKRCAIEITNACNLNCLICQTKLSRRPVGFIEPRTFEIILQQLKTTGIRTVGLHTVGEPFMYKNLEELFELAGGYGFRVWLSTNGQFPQRIEELYRKFPGLANWYRFSIDGATPQTYQYLRRGGSFDKLMESLKVIDKINNGKRNSHIYLRIDAILSMANIYEIPTFFEVYRKYCYEKQIDFHLPNTLVPDPSFVKKDFPFPNLMRSSLPCPIPFEEIYFTYGGRATLCCRDYEEELVIGDVQERTLTELWNGLEAERIRKAHLNPEKMDIRPCWNCFWPYPLVTDILNEYIHFLVNRHPQLSPRQFGDKVLSLLNKMDSVKRGMDWFAKTP